MKKFNALKSKAISALFLFSIITTLFSCQKDEELMNPIFGEVAQEDNLGKSIVKSVVNQSEVSILVLYTMDAKNSVSSIYQTVNYGIDQLNTAFRNSEIDDYLKVSLVDYICVDFQGTGDMRNDARGLPDNEVFKSLRSQYKADIVVLLTGDYLDYRGYVADIGPNKERAYAIVSASAVSDHIFAHEVGHLFGGRHDNCDNAHLYYEKGHKAIGKFYSVMSFAPNKKRDLYFSNPNVSHASGIVTGTSTKNVARKIREVAAEVAAFETGTPIYPLQVNISGPGTGYNNKAYTWSVSASGGTAPYSYLWQYSSDGVNFTGNWGTGTSITAGLPLNNDLFLKVTVTSSDGQITSDFHHVINLGNEGGGIGGLPGGL